MLLWGTEPSEKEKSSHKTRRWTPNQETSPREGERSERDPLSRLSPLRKGVKEVKTNREKISGERLRTSTWKGEEN